MKTTILKPALMLAVFGLAIFSAFAFNTVKPEKALTVFQGHIENSPGNCENKEVDCQIESNGKPCLFGVTQLRKMNGSGTDCPTLLWEIDE